MAFKGATDINMCGESRKVSFLLFNFCTILEILWKWRRTFCMQVKNDHRVQTDEFADCDTKQLRSHLNVSVITYKSELTQAVWVLHALSAKFR